MNHTVSDGRLAPYSCNT